MNSEAKWTPKEINTRCLELYKQTGSVFPKECCKICSGCVVGAMISIFGGLDNVVSQSNEQ